MKIRIPTIEPRDYQVPFLKAFDNGAQYSVISWHRRAGKDVTSFNAMVKRAKQQETITIYFQHELGHNVLYGITYASGQVAKNL